MIRTIRRAPGFFAVAASLIAFGVTATTLIFTLVDAVLLRPLAVKDPQNLVEPFQIYGKAIPSPYVEAGLIGEVAEHSTTVFDVFAQFSAPVLIDPGGYPKRVLRQYVSDNFFSVLGIKALLGRTIDPGETHVAVLSFDCWTNTFGRDSRVIGRTVRIEGHPFQIIGVTPENFTGTTLEAGADVRIPQRTVCEFSLTPKCTPDSVASELIARLRPGVSLRQAQEELSAHWKDYGERTAEGYPDSTWRRHYLEEAHLELQSITRGFSPMRTQFQAALVALLAGTGLIMLMVCSNVGGLLMARAAALEKETAIRLALGATRGRIVRHWIAQSLILSLAGGIAGMLLAFAGIPLLASWIPPVRGISVDLSLQSPSLHMHPDLKIAAFSLLICALTTILSAIAPAWLVSRGDLQLALKTAMSDRRHRRLQAGLCAMQVAFCTVLLISAGLMVRSFENQRDADPGFDRNHVVTFSIDPMLRRLTGEQNWSLQSRFLEGARQIAGVETAGISGMTFMQGYGHANGVVFPGERLSAPFNTSVNEVTPGYFETMGMRLIAGRDFSENDSSSERKPKPVIVNQAFVRRFRLGQNPVGRVFDTAREFKVPTYQIIGVVNDTKYRFMREVPPPIFYTFPFGPKSFPNRFVLNIRTHGDPEVVIQPVRKLLQSIDPEMPITTLATLAQEIDRSLWQERLTAWVASIFSLFALLLSGMGLYGILAYYVARTKREIGLRMALGAERRNVISLVARRILPALAVGVMVGGTLAFLTSRWTASLLYGVKPLDLRSNVVAIVLLGAIAVAAAAAPTVRAIRVDPAITLREE